MAGGDGSVYLQQTRDVDYFGATGQLGELNGPGGQSIVGLGTLSPNTAAITSLAINQNTGLLTAETTTVADANWANNSGSFPSPVFAVDPRGRFVYGARTDNFIQGFIVNPDKTLTGVSTSNTIHLSNTGFPAVFHPSGNFLYYPNYGNVGISGFLVDPNTGILTEMAGSPFSVPTMTTTGITTIAASPNGEYLFCTVEVAGPVMNAFSFSVNQVTGVLTAIGGVVFPNSSDYAEWILVTPDGINVYTFGGSAVGINCFQVNNDTGALSGNGSHGTGHYTDIPPVMDNTGSFIFASSHNSGSIDSYSISIGTGIPVKVNSATAVSGDFFKFLAIHPTKNFLYAGTTSTGLPV